MRLTLTDIKTKYPAIASALPEMLLNLQSGKYFIFGYEDNAHGGGITINQSTMKVYPQIDLSIYKIQHGGHIGYFTEPFETGNILFYKTLRYFCKSDSSVEEIKKLYKVSSAREQAENNYVFSSDYENTFSISDHASLEKALLRFFRVSPSLVNPLLTVFDSVDSYCEKTKQESFYGNYLEKVVHAVPSPDGGLIPEGNGRMRYMYVGESGFVGKVANDKLEQAKKLLRDGADAKYIYNHTGWFVNRFDGKWRMIISDAGASYTKKVQAFIDRCIKTQSAGFFNGSDEMQKEFFNNMNTDLSMFTEKHPVILSEILDHKELYEVYPELKFLKVFFGISLSEAYRFYSNPKGFLCIYGNPNMFNIKRVMLHEIQHWVQEKEGFGKGGDPSSLAPLVSSLGGKNVRSFMNLMERVKEYFNKSGRCTPEETKKLCRMVFASKSLSTHTKNVFSGIELLEINSPEIGSKVVMNIADCFINEKNDSLLSEFIIVTYGDELANILIKLKQFVIQGASSNLELSRLGYGESDFGLIYFKIYELLSGELEARDTQNMPYSDEVFKEHRSVFTPLSNETFVPGKVEVIVGYEKETGNHAAGCEFTPDKKYILHITAGVKAEPLLHELGHILWDYFTDGWSTEEKEKIKWDAPQEEEIFVEEFLNYLAVNMRDEKIKKELSVNRKKPVDKDKPSYVFFQNIFNS